MAASIDFLRQHQPVSYGHIFDQMCEWLQDYERTNDEQPDTCRHALEYNFAEKFGMYNGTPDGDVDYTDDLRSLADMALKHDAARRLEWERDGWSTADSTLIIDIRDPEREAQDRQQGQATIEQVARLASDSCDRYAKVSWDAMPDYARRPFYRIVRAILIWADEADAQTIQQAARAAQQRRACNEHG